MNQYHVVYGANGALGSAIVQELVAQGLPTRAVVRNVAKAQQVLPQGAEIVAGDATDRASVRDTSSNAAVLYNIVNVPYQHWYAQMPLIADNIMAAAETGGAKMLFAGNFYSYGHFGDHPVREDHPRKPNTKKGELRKVMEERMLAAHTAGRVPVIIPRMPEFFGPNVTNKLIAPTFKAALAGKGAQWPANLDQPHEMIYNADAARASVLLANTDSAYGQTWHLPGAGTITGRQFLNLIYEAAGTTPKVGTLPKLLVQFGGVFNPEFREFAEMMYQFAEPYKVDGSKFAAAFPSFRYTPHAEAVRATLDWFRQYAVALKPV